MRMLHSLEDLPQPGEGQEKVQEFFNLFKRANEPCPPEDDCGDLLSSCCGSILSTVFGTLPLEVECTSCGKVFLLKEVLDQ